MKSGLVNASFSLPEWQAAKMIFFAPCVAGTREHVSRRASMSGWAAYIHIYVMRIPHAVRIENVTACLAFVFTKSHFAQAMNYVVSAA